MQPTSGEQPADIFQQAEKIIQGLKDGASFGSAINFNDRIAESLYSRGYVQYSQGRYEDAAKTFGFILFNDPSNIRAMRGMASSLQMQGKYEEALLFLGYAAVGDDSNADIALQVIECLLHLGRKNDASKLLADVEKALESDPCDEYVQNKAKGLRALMQIAKDSENQSQSES